MEKTKLLILRITDRCNLACKYCYAATESQKDMTTEIAKAAVDLFAAPGDKLKIQFTGGEPLLCPDLIEEVFCHVKEREIQAAFSIQTNGTLLNDKVCNLLKKLRCAVGVSLDGIGGANGLRVYPDGAPALEGALEGIRNLARYGIHCNLNAVLSRQNQSGLGELVELAALCGNVHGVGLDVFRPMGRGEGTDLEPSVDTLRADLERMIEKQEQLKTLGVNVRIKELEKVRAMLRTGVRETCYCYAGTGLSAAVDPRGDIFPCASFVGVKDMCMGNIGDYVSGIVCDITSENEKALRMNRLSPIVNLDDDCRTCPDKSVCRGGCPAGRIASGRVNIADCLMHRVMIEHGG